MSGYSKLYVVGSLGGYQGADGVNPIEFLILIGDAHRQWLEPHYFDRSIKPIGKLRSMVPAGPDHPDALLDACIAFCPRHFESCPSLLEVKSSVGDVEHLDFDLGLNEVPEAWERLREEARPVFADMNIWRADLVPSEEAHVTRRPSNADWPFFAYGLFRPGQLAFFQLGELVSSVVEPAHVAGSLRLRDGLPIIDPEGHGDIDGALLTFLPERAAEAYARISAMEPDKHYRWDKASIEGAPANVLVGRSPRKGSAHCEEVDWNGWNDPLFREALDVVEETLVARELDRDALKRLFRLQMAYLLLWSSIERYVSLRYRLGDRVMGKVGQLAFESAFAEGLRRHVKERRVVYRADRPGEKEVLDPNSPGKSLNYYYQVRSNITHRGKAAMMDCQLLQDSLTELLPIFREVLEAAEHDAGYSPKGGLAVTP